MAERGMTREQALDAATALYPAEMAGLDHPWLNGLLWRGRDASSPDTAAKALADEGRIRDGYVDTLWEAIRADVETVQRAKARQLDQAYRETASALESGKRAIAERLAAIRAETAERTATGRLSIGTGNARAPIAIPNDSMTARDAKAILDTQRGKIFVNHDDGREATFNGNQINKMLGRKATDKSLANGFSMSQHNQAAARAGELYENATLIEGRPDNTGDPNIIAIRRYAAPVTFGDTAATAWLTIKESEQNGNRIYSLELLELTDPRLSIGGPASNRHRHARESTDTVPYPGGNVNPIRAVRGELDQATEAHREAERKGDVKTAQRLVEEAAERAGYTIRATHGAPVFGFTVFDPDVSDDRLSLFFAEDVGTAGSYSGVDGIREIHTRKGYHALLRRILDASRYQGVVDAFEESDVAEAKYVALDEDEAEDYGDEGYYELSFKADDEVIARVPLSVLDRTTDWDFEDLSVGQILSSFPEEAAGNYAVALRIERPLVIDAQGNWWDNLRLLDEAEGDVGGNTREIAKYAKQHGYDGVIIQNVHDVGGKAPQLAPDLDTVYIVFAPRQIKSLDPFTYDGDGNLIPISQRFDPRTPDIRRSVGGEAPLPTGVPLVAMHFLPAKHLASALKHGGLPTPSIAVAREDADWNLPNGYGDCLLFFKKETVDPKADPRNVVFPGDAMTPRYPKNTIKKGSLDAALHELERMGWPNPTEAALRKEANFLVMNPGRNIVDEIETPMLFALWVRAVTGETLADPESVRAYAERLRDPETGAIDLTLTAKGQWDYTWEERFIDGVGRFVAFTSRAPASAKAAQEAFDAIPVKPLAWLNGSWKSSHDLDYPALIAFEDIEAARTAMTSATKGTPPDAKRKALDRLADAIAKPGVPHATSIRRLANDLAHRTALDDTLALFQTENKWYATTPEARDAFLDFVRLTRNIKKDYYEAKPRRIIGLGEIALAIVPQSNLALQEALSKRGIPFETYDAPSGIAIESTADIAQRAIAKTRFSVGGWLEGRRWARESRADEARFAQAHAEGDRTTAEALVLKHARLAGYVHEAWRGTDDFGRVNLGLRRYGAPNHAVFLAGTPEMAGTYAANPEVREVGRGNQKGSGIYHVAIRFANPLIVDAQGATWDTIPADAEGHVTSTRDLAYRAIQEGRDGVIIHNLQDHNPLNDHGAPRTPATVYIVTGHPQNIKSLDPFTYDGDGNLIPLTQRFDPRTPDIRRSVGGVDPAATPARQKEAHGAYPDLGEEIATARFAVGAKRKAEYRALIAKARPTLPQGDVDAFMAELDTLDDTKKEKAALHWFVKGSLILPEDRDKLDMATQMAGKYHLDFQAFDSPAALINEANARAEAKKKKPAIAYLDPDAVPQLYNRRDLGHGVVIYDVEDSPAGQQAMRQIMNSHLGRNADGEFWSPWCLLTCSPTTGALSESARKYWAHYSEAGRAAAFHNGKLCAFQSSDTRDRQWWDLNDKSHGANIPLTYSVRARDAWQTDAVPEEATVIMHDEIDETNGSVVHSDPDEKAIIGDRKNGHYQEWRMMRGRSVLTYDGYFKNGKANGPSMQRDYAPISWDVEQRIVPLVVEFVGEPGLLTMHAEFKDGAMTKPARAMDEQGRLWKIYEPQDSAKTWRMADIVGHVPPIGVPKIDGISLRVIDRRNDRCRFDFLTGMELGRGKYHEARHISEAYPDLAELFDFPPKGEKRKVWTAPRRSIIGGAFAKPPQIRQIEGIRADSAERLNPVVPFAGNKTAIINAHARFFRDLGKAAIAAGGKTIDAFAGAGAYTIGLGVLGALPKGSVLNEWSVARYTMHKMLAKDPAAVVDAIRDLVGRLEASDAVSTLRATLEAIREGRAEKRKVAQPVVDWFLDELNGKHGVDYVQAPGNSAFGDARMKENAQTAALYVVLQSMSTQSRPINFVWDDKAGQAAIDVAGKKADSGTLSMRFVSKDNTLKEDAFGTAQYTRRVREAGTIYQEAGLDVRRGDGWAIAKTANRGDVVFVDPAYLGVQAYGGGKNSKTSIDANDAETAIAKLVDLATWADANGVSLVYSNEFSDKSKGKKGGLTQEQYAEIWEEAMKRIGPDKARVGYMMRNRNTANADVIFATGQAKPALDAAIRRSVASTRRPPIEAKDATSRADALARALLPVGDENRIDARQIIIVADVPNWMKAYGFDGEGIAINGKILKKLHKKHAFTPETFAHLVEALGSPVLAMRDKQPLTDIPMLTVLTDVPAPDMNGRIAPIMASFIRNGTHVDIASAYSRTENAEKKYANAVKDGTVLFADKARAAKNPLLARALSLLDSFNGPSDPNTNTVAYSAPEVKPQSRRAIGGTDERLRAVNARVRTAALYYGRSPAEADIAQRAIVEVALFAEASRTGKTLKTDDVRRAYADFGIETDDRHAATIADRINEQARQERYTPRKKGNATATPRDAILQQQERLRQAYDIHWTQAQKDAFAQGVAGAFGASRDLARDAMEVAKTKRDEAEAVLGLDPAISAATSAPTATNSRPCSPTTAPSPSTKTRPKPSSASPSTTATPESSTMRLRGWDERRSGGLGGETLRGLTRNP